MQASRATSVLRQPRWMPAAVGLRLMRKCACGKHAPGGESCTDCQKKNSQPLQAKLAVGALDDVFEQQADRVADAVSRSASHGEVPLHDALAIRRAPASSSSEMDGQTSPLVERALNSGGQPLDTATRAFMEPRFLQDFSSVRVHTDATASESAHAVGALAYTVGRNLVFARGQFQPHSAVGRHLLAHELTHVVQQGQSVLRRAPDPGVLKDFDDRAAKIKKNKVLLKQPADARHEVDQILTEARKRDNAMYYIDKLEKLLAKPVQSAAEQAKQNSADTKTSADAEASRMGDNKAQSHAGDEEAISADPSRVFTKAKGLDGKTFLIDARDVTNVAVKVKVHLIRAGKGTADDVKGIKSMEDAIEKRSSTMGYNVDINWVEKSGPDVFDVNVDTSKWTVSDNWSGDDAAMAHELHHRLGLEEDRYDYIEAHAENEAMLIPDRIHWFLAEMDKKIDNNPNSIMDDNVHSPLDDDVCMVAGKKTKADIDACVKQRTDARNKILGPPMGMASCWALRAFGRLSGVQAPAPPTPGSVKGEPTMEQMIVQRAASMGEQLFGQGIPVSAMADNIGATRMELTLWNLQLASALVEGCDSGPAVSQQARPRIRLCPNFFALAQGEQAHALLREAFHVTGVGEAGKDTPCTKAGCDDLCGDSNNAEAWVRLTRCVAEI